MTIWRYVLKVSWTQRITKNEILRRMEILRELMIIIYKKQQLFGSEQSIRGPTMAGPVEKIFKTKVLRRLENANTVKIPLTVRYFNCCAIIMGIM